MASVSKKIPFLVANQIMDLSFADIQCDGSLLLSLCEIFFGRRRGSNKEEFGPTEESKLILVYWCLEVVMPRRNEKYH